MSTLDDWRGSLAGYRFGLSRDMEENGVLETARSRSESEISCGSAHALQKAEDAVYQSCRIELPHRDISGREKNRETAASRRRFKQHASRPPVLWGGTDLRTHNIPECQSDIKYWTRELDEAFANISIAGDVTVRTSIPGYRNLP